MYGRQHHQRVSNKTHSSVTFDSVAYATGSMIEWCASYANKEFFMKKKCVASLAAMVLATAAFAAAIKFPSYLIIYGTMGK